MGASLMQSLLSGHASDSRNLMYAQRLFCVFELSAPASPALDEGGNTSYTWFASPVSS